MGAGSSATKSAVDGIKQATKEELVVAVKDLSLEEKQKLVAALDKPALQKKDEEAKKD
jgi:hypothetical protein